MLAAALVLALVVALMLGKPSAYLAALADRVTKWLLFPFMLVLLVLSCFQPRCSTARRARERGGAAQPLPPTRTNHVGIDGTAGTGAGTFQVQVVLDGCTLTLQVASHWTELDVMAALEAKANRSLSGSYLVTGGRLLSRGAKPMTLGALGKNARLQVRHRLRGGMGAACGKQTTVDHTDVVLEGADSLPSAAKAALRAAVKAHGIRRGTPQKQGLALAQKGLWAETWDGGISWHPQGDPNRSLSPEEAAAERKVKEVVEAEDYAAFDTIQPDSEASAAASHARGVTIEFLVNWTKKHKCWDMPTWQVVRDIIKPVCCEPDHLASL